MNNRFQEADASQDFKCEDCKSVVIAGSKFFWDKSRKCGPRKFSARLCTPCKTAASDDSLPPTAATYSKSQLSNSVKESIRGSSEPQGSKIFNTARESVLEGKINSLESRLATLEKVLFKDGFILLNGMYSITTGADAKLKPCKLMEPIPKLPD